MKNSRPTTTLLLLPPSFLWKTHHSLGATFSSILYNYQGPQRDSNETFLQRIFKGDFLIIWIYFMKHEAFLNKMFCVLSHSADRNYLSSGKLCKWSRAKKKSAGQLCTRDDLAIFSWELLNTEKKFYIISGSQATHKCQAQSFNYNWCLVEVGQGCCRHWQLTHYDSSHTVPICSPALWSVGEQFYNWMRRLSMRLWSRLHSGKSHSGCAEKAFKIEWKCSTV